MDPTQELDTLLDRWHREVFGNSGASPVPLLTSIAELIERETEAYLKLPIDPFDDRHPTRTYPECSFGVLLKALFKNENFMSQLTNDYITGRSGFELHVISCRLLLDILPGLDSTVVFMESDQLVKQLLEWAEKADFPLHSYATGLLGAAMEVPEISILYREQNNQLVPLMFNRLNQITHISSSSADRSSDAMDVKDHVDVCDTQPYAIHSKLSERNRHLLSKHELINNSSSAHKDKRESNGSMKRNYSEIEDDEEDTLSAMPAKISKKSSQTNLLKSPVHNECSSSSWAEAYMSGSYQMHPLSTVMQQRFILQYLAALGDYQELIEHLFEHKALSYILHFIDGRKNQDIRLAFDSLKFLAAFLTHKKFAFKFLEFEGLPRLLRVNRHGMASSGVSICLYYLAYNEDVMQAICWMEKHTVKSMVCYGLWLLECSHDSSRAHAAMFFSLCFQFPLLLNYFDGDHGLRKLLNVISMRGLFSDDPSVIDLTDDEIFSRRQTAKQVCIALKKYTRAHFVIETKKCKQVPSTQENIVQSSDLERKPICISDDNVLEVVELHRKQAIPDFNWRAIDRMVQEDGVKYLLKTIAYICNEGMFFAGKSETARSALEILVVCSLSPRVQQLLMEESIRLHSRHPVDLPALAIIVMCADPKTLDADCQKSALNILLNFVSTNHQAGTSAPNLNTSLDIQDQSLRMTPGGRKRGQARNLVDLTVASRKAIWANNGTLILPKLLAITSPLTEADAIRSLACRVLCGLAKEESIRQILSKLPLFTDGQLQTLMKEPILPEKTSAHASFCDSCKELIELVTGTPVTSNIGAEPSLDEIRRQKIVSQTKIDYDRTEAYHLIHSYLNSEGFPEIASALYKSANLSSKGFIQQTIPRAQPHLTYKKLNEPATSITLDSIFTEYLRHQHSLCKNPVSTCPPFQLLAPHRCPEPRNMRLAPLNIASRIIRRRALPQGGMHGQKFNRHYVYSKFRPLRLVRDSMELRTSSTCCAFSRDSHFLFVGTDTGNLKAFNINSGLVEANYDCHANEIGYIESNSEDNLILTTSPDSPPIPQCILWTFSDVFERKYRFDNDLHAEFGKKSSDRIITTGEHDARLWDTATGTVIQTYPAYHRYTCNRATLNYSDTLALNDGVLWDVRTSISCHKFGKFNERINGIFHPHRDEIICNSQVWDIRNFRLLRTVPAFDMCQLKFNSMGDVIFSTILDDQAEVTSKIKSEFKTSFRTFDSYDYSTIATIDLERTISDLAVSADDKHIALVESSGNSRCFHEEYATDSNICRLYEIGTPSYDADIDAGDDDDDEDEDGDDEENEDDDDLDEDLSGYGFDEMSGSIDDEDDEEVEISDDDDNA